MLKLENMKESILLVSAQAISNDYVCDDYKALEKQVKSIIAVEEGEIELKEIYLEQFRRLHEFQESTKLTELDKNLLCLDILEKAITLVKVLKGNKHRYLEGACMDVQDRLYGSAFRLQDINRFQGIMESVERLGLDEEYNVPLTRVGFEDIIKRLSSNIENHKITRDKALEIWEELDSCKSFIKFTGKDKTRLNNLLGLINVTKL
ncbi:hypothetical protein UT300012_21430 [Paraclostridium bifermentans]